MFTVLFIIQDSSLLVNFKQACLAVRKNMKDFSPYFFSVSELETNIETVSDMWKRAILANFIYIELHGGTPYFSLFPQLERECLRKVPFFLHSGLEDENVLFQSKSLLAHHIYAQIFDYHLAGGVTNYTNLIYFLLHTQAGINTCFDKPLFPQTDGIYDLPVGMSEEQYVKEVTESGKIIVGVIVHYHYVRTLNTKHIDALKEALCKVGAAPLIFYSNMVPCRGGGLHAAIKKYFFLDDKPIVSSVIVTVGFSMSLISDSGVTIGSDFRSIFQELDVPVLQAITTPYNYNQWQASQSGLSPMYLSSVIFQPEFDGQIISLPIACTEKEHTPYGERDICSPISDRIDKIARTALNWGRLKHIAAEDKRIAIIFHNMPPRVDMIGCAYGLDSHASVFAMCEALADIGIYLDKRFSSGKEIIELITAGVTNDMRFTSLEEQIARANVLMEAESYKKHFNNLPAKNKCELISEWGLPPGDFMASEEQILIPGIINGNIFIGLQPPRAFTERAEEAYHSTEIICPHQYIAFYKWLKEDFGAHIIIHVGTHGTIEWLPGKENALSSECWPDIAIDDLPNLYPYIIDVPGEGAQAKRRISAVIIDHLIPAMDDAGLYGVLNTIDLLVEQYYHVRQADRGKVHEIAAEILALCRKEGIVNKSTSSDEKSFEDIDGAIEEIHMHLSDIKSTKIKDGLHILGQVPSGQKLSEMLRLLLAVKNDNIPSLREGAALAASENLDELLSHPETVDCSGYTNAMRLSNLDNKLAILFDLWQTRDFSKEAIISSVKEIFGTDGDTSAIIKTMDYAQKEIIPRLNRTSDELQYLINGVCGKFVIPGPSGSPSRGGASLLPTGRNFYSIDPTCVPSRAAWRTGIRMAESLLEKYKKENNNTLPESVAIVVYSGDTMKTRGDDIAEIMYLYGIRPIWLPGTDRVIDIQPISLEELGRARIDVTLRISGLFRDTFPNLIERIEDAVNMAAAQDEPLEQNFIKKHINEDMQLLIRKGLSRNEAYSEASIRVFGCPPGTYGAGVDIMMHSKKWKDNEDLATAYVNWSAHAYTRKIHGRKMTEAFTRRLAVCSATVKNISSYESDMLDDDDYYSYHGGLISAIKSTSGKAPTSMNACSADPDYISTKTIQEETAKIIRARVCNPKWIKGLKEHGFRGAQEFSATIDIAFGWDATACVLEDWMYDRIADTYFLDTHLASWINDNNQWAMHAMAERMLEAHARGMWKADENRLKKIQELYSETDGNLEGM